MWIKLGAGDYIKGYPANLFMFYIGEVGAAIAQWV
jgi:hypothetical protein